ncbi:D-lyxose/D-mannose family sugar isomerase [Lacrimispora sp. 38-1]|uniref:D-lyxose/D-mannose family sugar isomerase n=1 Tax=Lacrimispora sp. 38-1 TaxID=3125778 RepID=UPI003CF495DD
MKRSEINKALKDMEQMVKACGFSLPPFCRFTPEEWREKGHEYDEIRDNMLGWDITDFGLGDFDRTGFSLITLRNGNVKQKKYTKTYAEKLLYLKEGQSAAMHFHWNKMEDIINRGGGNVLIRVYESTADGSFSDSEVTVSSDGRSYRVPAGAVVTLHPGESITIYPYLYHDFKVEPHTGPVLLGEVSMCNDDKEDNRFYQPIGRFPKIEEDEPPYRLLCNEYPEAE